MGNICRSPLAEGVARQKTCAAGLSGQLEFDSAGTHAYHVGESPDPRAQAVASRAGIDISGLRARRIKESDFSDFDWILAMDRDNLATLRRDCPPKHHGKLKLLLEFANNNPHDEVPDPYYGNLAGFERVLELCESGVSGLITHCLKQPNRGEGCS